MSDAEIRRAAREAASLFHSGPGEIPAELAKSATDLSDVKRTSDEQAAAKEARENAIIQAIVYRWDRAMRKAFKGIVSSPDRYRMLAAADRRSERAA